MRLFAQTIVRFGKLVSLVALLVVGWGAGDCCHGQADNATDQESEVEAAARLFTDAANYQNNGAFALSATTWREFLERFPDEDRADEARYNLGVSELQIASQPGEDADAHFRLALEALLEVANNEASGLRPEAWLNVGLARYTHALRMTDQEQAREELQRAVEQLGHYVEKFPDAEQRDQALFYRGEAAYLRQDADTAIASYRRILADFPDSSFVTDGLYALGVALEESGKYAESQEQYALFLKAHPDHQLATEVTMRLGESLLQQKVFPEAREHFAQAASAAGFAQADHALFRVAFCLASEESYVEAAETFGSLVDRFPDSPYVSEATIAAGRSYSRAAQNNEAIPWYRKALALGGSPQADRLANEAAHWLNRLSLDRGEHDEVIERVESRLDKATPFGYLVHLKMDRADAWYGDESTRQRGMDEYKAIAAAHPDSPLATRAIYNLAFGHLEAERYQDALDVASHAVRQNPPDSLDYEVQAIAAESSLQLGGYDRSAEWFADLYENGPEVGRPYWGLRRALALHMAGEQDEASTWLEKVRPQLTTSAERAEADYVGGRIAQANGDDDRAVSLFLASHDQDAKWRQADEVLLSLSRSYRKTRSTDKAISAVQQLLSDFPESRLRDEARLRWAEYAYAARDFPVAFQKYQKVIDDATDTQWIPYALYGLGWARLAAGEPAIARGHFDRLIGEFPDHAVHDKGFYARGVALHRIGEYEPAQRDLELFVAGLPNAPQIPDALYLLALCDKELERHDAAATRLREIIETYPEYRRIDRVLYDLAWTAREQGRDDDAQASFQEIAERHPQSAYAPEAIYHLAEQEYAGGKYEQAMGHYRLVVEHDATRGNRELGEKAIYKEGWSLFQLQRYSEASNLFQRQIGEFAEGDLRQEAQFMVGECAYHEGDYDGALDHYRKLQVEQLRKEIRPLLYLHGGQSAAQVKRWEESLKWLAVPLERYPDSEYLPEIRYETGWAYHQTRRHDQALQQYQTVADSARSPIGARARFMIGEILFERKEYSRAVMEFQKVMYGYGGDRAPDSFHAWQAKSGFEAGQCASVLALQGVDATLRRRWRNEALKSFRYVVKQHPGTDEADRAQERLQQLDAS